MSRKLPLGTYAGTTIKGFDRSGYLSATISMRLLYGGSAACSELSASYVKGSKPSVSRFHGYRYSTAKANDTCLLRSS